MVLNHEVEMMQQLLQEMRVGDIPRRHSLGTWGSPIRLVSNLYGVSTTLERLFHYDVSIIPLDGRGRSNFDHSVPVSINRRVIQKLACLAYLGGRIPAFDGRSNLYLAQPLPSGHLTVHVAIPIEPDAAEDEYTRKVNFEVSIQLAAIVALDGLRPEAIQALNVVVRSASVVAKNTVAVGRSFFTRQPGDYLIGNCREMWLGYYSSIRPGQWKPLFNVNISATLFHESLPLVDYVTKFLKKPATVHLKDGLADFERRKLEQELRAVKIEVMHLPYKRRYKVAGISRKPASHCMIQMENRSLSVVQYFAEKYNRELEFPNLQCVLTQAKDGGKNFIPMEVCKTIAGQHAKLVGPGEITQLIRKTAIKPVERFQSIDRFVHSIVKNNAPDLMEEFGLNINLKPERMYGRVLRPPMISTGAKHVQPVDGQWRPDTFLVGATIEAWGIADCHGARRTREFAQSLQDIGKKFGMEILPPRFIRTYGSEFTPHSILSDIKSSFPETKLTVVILGRYTSYEGIKQVSESNSNLVMMTQCVRGVNLDSKKHDRTFVTNVLMKINSKMGGVNNGVVSKVLPAVLTRPFIVFGGDVSHPSPLNKKHSSIAAVVATMDHVPSKYYTVTSSQQTRTTNRLECIANLKDMVKECLKEFERTNRTKPLHLFFFRDGVSEGQFPIVRAFEVLQIRLACKELDENYQPPLTFLVVQKRHHVRFRPEIEEEGQGRARNIPAGTVIEEKVTHPTNFDFFLCSHAGIQGTSRPAHYQVIHDDANFSADELQTLSYNLCHTYGRCARSVSIPAPIYYAHLAAARARHHMIALDSQQELSESESSSGIDQPNEVRLRAIKVCESLRGERYFL
ncbi:protein argonaute-3-like [Tropilaelaps mercedesae]|uniref:Protein argonaute-3-like n=1 Tax=Tropilaelaps mercedesae TaxID=418985 RepID=A0A1V9XTG6_9ACAR|nr:protein argonaute-3-like [Tropilaelaps mercedesae]